jgi:hypothetical protein
MAAQKRMAINIRQLDMLRSDMNASDTPLRQDKGRD